MQALIVGDKSCLSYPHVLSSDTCRVIAPELAWYIIVCEYSGGPCLDDGTTTFFCPSSLISAIYLFMKLRIRHFIIMIANKYSPRILVACGSLLIVVYIFFQSSGAGVSSHIPWNTSGGTSSSQQKNYVPISLKKKVLDTTSEIGRASNTSLGVRDTLCCYDSVCTANS